MDQKKLAPGGNKLMPFSDGFGTGSTLGPRWTGSTWSISAGKAVNTPVTFGVDKITNGDFSSWSGDNPVGWTVANEDATSYITEAAGVARWVSNGSKTPSMAQNFTPTASYLWYRYTFTLTITSGMASLGASAGSNFGAGNHSASKTVIYTPRLGGTSNVYCVSGGTCDFTIDNITARALTTSELFATVNSGKSNFTTSVKITAGSDSASPMGLVVCLDDPASPSNFIVGYLAWRSAVFGFYLDKCVNGVYTNLTTGNLSYVAGATLSIKKYGNFVAMYYNGQQVGTTQIVTDAGIVNNTRHGMFGTNPSDTFDDFSITSPTFLFADLFTSALDAAWTGATWSVSGAAAVNTPALSGVELVPNGDAELNSDWTPDGTVVTSERSNEQAHGGTYSWKIVTDGANEGLRTGLYSMASGVWYQSVMWVHSNPSTIQSFSSRGGDGLAIGQSVLFTPVISTWTKLLQVARNLVAGANASLIVTKGSDVDRTVYHDDASTQALSLPSLIASISTDKSDLTLSVALTLAVTNVSAPSGIVICLDSAANPMNFLLAYHDGTNAKLDKCVNGTYTNVISAAATYGAGYILKVVKSGTSVSLYYNGAQVGTTQTVSDAGVINNIRHGMFSTYSGNTLDNFSVG